MSAFEERGSTTNNEQNTPTRTNERTEVEPNELRRENI